MKLEDLERVFSAAKRKKHFEHAADCMEQNATVTIAFHGETEKRSGQVHITLGEHTAKELREIFERNAKEATDELRILGVKEI